MGFPPPMYAITTRPPCEPTQGDHHGAGAGVAPRVPPHVVCRRDFLTAIRALAVRQTLTFAGVPDPLALVPPPPFRGFFVLPATPEFPEQPGVLQLPLQSTQGKLYIIVMHRDS